MRKDIRFITYAAMVAALYVVLTLVAQMFGLASGMIQIRLSEALTVLPAFFPAAIPGLTIGCLLANLVTLCAPWDVVFGSLATLLGAIGTYLLRKKNRFLAPIPPILANTLIIPPVLRFVYKMNDAEIQSVLEEGGFVNHILSRVYSLVGVNGLLAITVCVGEIIACGILGMIVCYAAQRAGLDKLDSPKKEN